MEEIEVIAVAGRVGLEVERRPASQVPGVGLSDGEESEQLLLEGG
jgi:hypothetical protein